MRTILVTFRYGSSSTSGNEPYAVFLSADLRRDEYLEARANHERSGYLISGETAIELPDGSVDLDRQYAAV